MPAVSMRQISLRDVGSVPSSFNTHVHQSEQWYACVSGGITVHIEGQMFPLRPGHSVLVPKGMGRSIRRDPESTYVFALFEDDELGVSSMSQRILTLDEDGRRDMSALVAELATVGDVYSAYMRESLLVRILIGLRRQTLPLSRQSESSMPLEHARLVRRVERIMRQNIHRAIRRSDIAQALHISEPHLARSFKAATGKTLHQRLTELRVAAACSLLKESTLSVSQVSAETGFASVSHFSKWFRASMDVSPTVYRDQYGLKAEPEAGVNTV